ASLGVPELHGVILARRGDLPAVEAERHAPDLGGVAAQGELGSRRRLGGRHTPDVDGVLVAGHHEPLAVGAERQVAAYRGVVCAEIEEGLLSPTCRIIGLFHTLRDRYRLIHRVGSSRSCTASPRIRLRPLDTE